MPQHDGDTAWLCFGGLPIVKGVYMCNLLFSIPLYAARRAMAEAVIFTYFPHILSSSALFHATLVPCRRGVASQTPSHSISREGGYGHVYEGRSGRALWKD